MSLSKIVISGRVVRAPEKRFTPSTNTAVTEFAIAVESPARDGSIETSVVKVITWRDLAERCAQEVKKGDLVAIDGRLQINNYTGSDGLKKRDVEVDAIAVENLSQTASGAPSKGAETGEGRLAPTGAKNAKAPSGEPSDLDSIFATEEEIPF